MLSYDFQVAVFEQLLLNLKVKNGIFCCRWDGSITWFWRNLLFMMFFVFEMKVLMFVNGTV